MTDPGPSRLLRLWHRLRDSNGRAALARWSTGCGNALRAARQHDFVAGRAWFDRTVILSYAALTGVIAVAFTLLSEAASDGFEFISRATALGSWIALVWTPALTVAVLWWTRRFAPGALGSGVPQVLRSLDEGLYPAQRTWLVSVRLSIQKVALVCGGLLAGLSIGREGPMVQVGAGVMHHARRWLRPQSGIDSH
ncbi:MAG: chloride channel protein, partial [Rhizobacter sp.]|nr:chloride channel protein [Rhizobacter sp.]